jgi:hypothetical protein
MLKNRRDKSQIVYLAWQVYPENISNVHLVYYLEACMDQHIFDLELNNLLRIYWDLGQKYFQAKLLVFAPVRCNELVEIRDNISIFLEMMKQEIYGLYSIILVMN